MGARERIVAVPIVFADAPATTAVFCTPTGDGRWAIECWPSVELDRVEAGDLNVIVRPRSPRWALESSDVRRAVDVAFNETISAPCCPDLRFVTFSDGSVVCGSCHHDWS